MANSPLPLFISPSGHACSPFFLGVGQPDDALDNTDDGGDAGPAEDDVQHTAEGLTSVEVTHAEVTEQDVQDGGGSLLGVVHIVGEQSLHCLFVGEGRDSYYLYLGQIFFGVGSPKMLTTREEKREA